MSRSTDKERKSKMTVAEAGKRGGEKTAETHDKEFYEEIGRKGGEKVAEERGSEFYSEIGTKGGSKGGAERAKQHEGTPEAAGKTRPRRGRSPRWTTGPNTR